MKPASSSQFVRYIFSAITFFALLACDEGDCEVSEAGSATSHIAGKASHDEDAALFETESTAPLLTIGDSRSGEATFYETTGKGNCSFDASTDLMVAAINKRDYAAASMCGAYVAVTGPKGTVIVRVVDKCPGCAQGDIDLSRQAFAKIADPAVGRVPITWQIVAGPVTGPVAYRYKESSSRFWTAIQVRNHRLPISKLEIMPKGRTDWINVERRAYNYFVHPAPIPAGPVRVRVTALTGATLLDMLPEPRSDLLVQGDAQFQ